MYVSSIRFSASIVACCSAGKIKRMSRVIMQSLLRTLHQLNLEFSLIGTKKRHDNCLFVQYVRLMTIY